MLTYLYYLSVLLNYNIYIVKCLKLNKCTMVVDILDVPVTAEEISVIFSR